MRYASFFLLVVVCIAVVSAEETVKVPPNPQKCEAGLETGKWKAEAWANEGLTVTLVAGDVRVLKLTYAGGDKEKAAFSQQTQLSADAEGKVRIHVYAPIEKPPLVAVYLLTGAKADWHEAKPFTVKQGWNEFEVALTTPNWKTAGTKWEFRTGVEHAEDVRGIGLIVLNGKISGWLAVQGLSMDAGKASKEIEALEKKMLSEDGEERAQAEKALAEIGRPAIPVLRKLKGNDRPEVALRAGWALDKIEASAEKERRAEESKNRETKAFSDAKRRAETLIENLKGSRAKLQQLASDARVELLRAQKAKDLKAPSEDQQKAYEELLKQLDAASKETLRMVGAPETKVAGEERKQE
jgi:hypothetical protein